MDKKYYLYYLIAPYLDEVDKVRYVGYTERPKQRPHEHPRTKPPHTFKIVEELEFDNVKDVKAAEKEHIKIHNTFLGEHGWNKTGGGGFSAFGENNGNYIDGLSQTNPNAYARKYYQNNKDKIKVDAKKWVEENLEKVKESKRKYVQKNLEKVREGKKQYLRRRRHPCLCLWTGVDY